MTPVAVTGIGVLSAFGVGTARFWERPKPRLPRMTYTTGDVVVEMIPETAKFNVNTVPEEQLLKVVGSLTGDGNQAREIVAGILDWRTGRLG